MDLPDVMIEAAAKALYNLDPDIVYIGGEPIPVAVPWDEQADQDLWRDEARIALVAALSVGETRQEWGVLWGEERVDSPVPFGGREKAERWIAETHQNYPNVPVALGVRTVTEWPSGSIRRIEGEWLPVTTNGATNE